MLELFLMIVDGEEDRALFTEMYNKYYKRVYHISNKHLQNHALAEEATQETFLYIAKNFDSFKKDNSNLKGYISTVARGKAISYFRKEKDYLLADFEDNIDNIPEIDDAIFDIYDQMTVRDAIEKLPEASANILQLKYVYGLESLEIAKLYNISNSAVRKRVERAKKLLKSILEEEENPTE